MKTILVIMTGLLGSMASQACTIADNGLYDRNILIGNFAAALGIDLTHTTSISVKDFSSQYEGSDPATSCPQRHLTSAKVTIMYQTLGGVRGPAQSCMASAVIHRKVVIFMPTPPEAYETIHLDTPEIACTN